MYFAFSWFILAGLFLIFIAWSFHLVSVIPDFLIAIFSSVFISPFQASSFDREAKLMANVNSRYSVWTITEKTLCFMTPLFAPSFLRSFSPPGRNTPAIDACSAQASSETHYHRARWEFISFTRRQREGRVPLGVLASPIGWHAVTSALGRPVAESRFCPLARTPLRRVMAPWILMLLKRRLLLLLPLL